MRTSAFLLWVAALAACADSKSAPELTQQPPASNTGSIALVTAGGRYKLYVPAVSPTSGHAFLAVVDPLAADQTSGLIRHIDLGVDGLVRAVAGGGSDLVAVDAMTPVVYFLDAAEDVLVGTAALPAAAVPMTSSGFASYSLGAAVDVQGRKAYVSTSQGIQQYDIAARTALAAFPSPPTEGFALDANGGRLYSPYYFCGPDIPCDPPDPAWPAVIHGLSVIDIGANTTYTLIDPSAVDPRAPIGQEADSVAVDFPLELAVVAIEEPSSLHVLDLSAATFDGAALTCQAPDLVVNLAGFYFTMIAADSVTHLLVAAQENDEGLLFLDLAKAKTGVVDILEAPISGIFPARDPWINHGDVHGVTIGVIDGHPYAFILSSGEEAIARIDLRGVAEVMKNGGDLASSVRIISVPAPP